MAKAAPTAPAVTQEKTSRSKGVTTGLRIYEFQNQTLEANAKKRLTDEQLAAMWSAEFPNAMDFANRLDMVRTVRSLYNKGKHKNEVPAEPLVGYDENKKPVAAPARGRKAAAEAEAPVAASKKGAKAAPVAAPAKLKIKK